MIPFNIPSLFLSSFLHTVSDKNVSFKLPLSGFEPVPLVFEATTLPSVIDGVFR